MKNYTIRTRVKDTRPHGKGIAEITEPAIDIEADVTIDKDTYSNKITIGVVDRLGKESSEQIQVIHNNKQNGFEVDAQRQKAINKHLTKINKV